MRFLAVLMAMSACLLLSACGVTADGPRAKGGLLDLRHWRFEASGAVELRGEWGFGWGGDPTSAFAGQPHGFVTQPAVWNRTGNPGNGRATLSLTILLPGGGPPLALAVPDVNSAYRLHINGSPAISVGRLGDDSAEEVPVYLRPLVRVPPGVERLDLVMEISNHHHFEGGMSRPIRIGPVESLDHDQEIRELVSVASLGALGVVLLLQLAFWAGGRRERAFLLFAAFTALMAARASASGLVYAMVDANLRSDLWYLLPAYVTLFAFPGIYLAFLRELFPSEVPRWVVLPAVVVSMAALACAIALPPAFYTRLRDPFQILILVMPIIGAILLGLAVHRRRVGALWMLAGSTAFLATVVNDSLHYQRVIASTDLSSLGFAALAVGYAAALGLRLFRSERMASQRLEVLNRDLEAKVAERTRRLAEAKAAAERASLAKSEFLAVMSHEIRTPLHGFTNLMELLDRSTLSDSQRTYVDTLRSTGQDLSRLLGDILDMAQIEAGRTRLDYVAFDLTALLDDLIAHGTSAAKAKDLGFEADLAPNLPGAVLGDERAVRRIVTKFLDNAIKFTAAGTIRLNVLLSDKGRVHFAVTDCGCGVPPEQRDAIFAPFTQVDSSSRREHGGSGLGLAICKSLAVMMGGTIGMKPAQAGGSVFWCSLPLPATDEVPEQRPRVVGRALPPGTKVLIADDMPLNRMVLRDFLTGAAAVVDEASDGAEAIAMERQRDYDLVVLDLRMPGTDGFQAAAEISRRPRDRKLPLVALTAGAAAEERRRARESGFDLFLVKPIDRETLLAALAGLLPDAPIAASLPPPPDIPAGLEQLMPAFLAEMAKDAVQLVAIKDGDRMELAEFVHAMRGKCGMFGEKTMFGLLTKLEQIVLTATPQEINDLVTETVEREAQLKLYSGGQPAGAS